MVLKKHIRSGLKTLINKITGKRFPIKINFVCTPRCTNRCIYCNVGKLREKYELSTDKVKQMLLELSKAGAEQITFIGGEPLMRKDIGELISYSKKLGLLTTISTNCELIQKKKDELHDLDLIITTLNGPKRVHDSIRGKGNYDKVMQIINSTEFKTGKIISCIITKQNIKHIDYLLELSYKKRFYLNFQPVFNNQLAKVENVDLSKIMPSSDEIKKVFTYLIKKKKEGYLIINSYPALKTFAEHGMAIFKKCKLGELSITIDSKGNVYRCYKYVNNTNKINGFKIGFKNAINQIKKEDCKECYYGCHIEDNYLFNLNLSSMINIIRIGIIFRGKSNG